MPAILMLRIETIVAQFGDIDYRPLSIGKLHSSASRGIASGLGDVVKANDLLLRDRLQLPTPPLPAHSHAASAACLFLSPKQPVHHCAVMSAPHTVAPSRGSQSKGALM